LELLQLIVNVNCIAAITVHPWCGVHFTNINACRVWGVRAEV